MRGLFGGALLLAALCTPALATEVTLREALRAAVAERPALQAARARAEAAAAAVGEARSGWLPRLALHEGFTRTDEPAGNLFIALNQERNVMADPAYDLVDPRPRSDFETRLQLTQTLYDPAVAYGLRRADVVARASAAAARWSAEEAAFAAFRAYLDVQHAEAALVWTASAVREAAETVRLAAERQAAGTGLKADSLRAGVQLAEAQRRELATNNDLILARRRLALAMGEVGGERRIAAPLVERDLAATAPSAEGGRADLAALALQVEERELAVRQSRADWLPRLGVSARYVWHDAQSPLGSEAGAWGVGAGLDWELFDGMRRSAATARAMADQRAAAASLDEARREQAFRLDEARLRAEEAGLLRDSAHRATQAAAEGRRLLQERYAAGLAELVDLLAAQSALDQARFDATFAESRHLLALGNIHFQAGRFVQTLLPGEELPR